MGDSDSGYQFGSGIGEDEVARLVATAEEIGMETFEQPAARKPLHAQRVCGGQRRRGAPPPRFHIQSDSAVDTSGFPEALADKTDGSADLSPLSVSIAQSACRDRLDVIFIPPARRAVGHESDKCGQSVAGHCRSRPAGASLYHLRGDKWCELDTKVVTTDRKMAGAAGASSPEMLRKLTMGLVVRQGCTGGHRPLRQAAWPGEYDVQPPLLVSIARSAGRG